MTPSVPRTGGSRRAIALLAALALVIALPASGVLAKKEVNGYENPAASYVDSTGNVAGVEFHPLVNSGDEIFGDLFEGLPDGIGIVPGPGNQGWVDMYVNHEQSHVPFRGLADFQDSSVTRLRIDLSDWTVTDMDIALPASAGFLRFCSAFMAGPEHGFPHYTMLLNEETNDVVPVPAGAPYGADPALAPNRQGGYAVYLDTSTGKYDVMPNQGRHNHENTVIVPGGWDSIVALSGDDTFTFPSTPERPNLSQVYMSMSPTWRHFQKDDTTLLAFRVTAVNGNDVDATDPQNDANDYFEIQPGDTFAGEFIPVPGDIARGDTGDAPQDALEDWSNANNVFQFIRVEDIAYDPDDPNTVYFADTGNSRLVEDPTTGRLYRASAGGTSSNGRIFKMVLNAADPRQVDEFSILAEAGDLGMRAPDNMDAGHNSLMVQEDANDAKIWMYSFADETWTHVATANITDAETSGIVDVSRWFGAGWWALDVQVHDPAHFVASEDIGGGVTLKREDGQVLLMHVPGS